MPGPLDFLQQEKQNVGQSFSDLGSWLHGLLPSQPAQQTPSVSNSPLSGMSPTGGVPVSTPQRAAQPDYMGQTPARPQTTGTGLGFFLQHPGDFLAETGVTQAGQDFNTKLKNLGDQIGGAKDLAGQDLTQDLHGAPGTEEQHKRWAKLATDPINYINDAVQNFVQPAVNPEMWFASDDNPHPQSSVLMPGGFDNAFGSGKGHNYLRDAFAPALKALTGEDVPIPTTSYSGRAQALQQEQQNLLSTQSQLDQQGNLTQDQIDGFNAKLSEYQAHFDKYMADYNHSADWWANSNTSKILRATGELIGLPIQFFVGSQTFLPMLLSNPAETGSNLIGQIQQGVSFAGALKDGSASNMSSQELVANLSNLVNLSAMAYGGVHPLAKGIAGKFSDPHAQNEAVQELQNNIPDLNNPPGGAIQKASDVAQARASSPVKEDPQSIRTRVADLQRNLSQAQRMLQTETDPVMKKTLIEQTTAISDEIRSLQNQPRQPAGRIPISPRTPTPEELAAQGPLPTGPSTEPSWMSNLPEGYVENWQSDNQRMLTEESAVDATVREKVGERGPSTITPEVITDPTHPDYQWESKAVLGPNYQFLEPRPEDFILNATTRSSRPIETVDDFAQASPIDIRQMLIDTPNQPTTVEKAGPNAWIHPDGKLALPLDEGHGFIASDNFLPGGTEDEQGAVQSMFAAGWVKKSNIGGMINFGFRGLTPRKLDTINRAVMADMRTGIPPYPYQIADETTGRPAVDVTPQEFAANGFDIAPILEAASRRSELIAFAQQGDQHGIESKGGNAGQTGEAGQILDRPEGTPEGTTLTAILPSGPQGQTPIALWKTSAEPTGSIPGGSRASQLETRQAFLDAANKAVEGSGYADPIKNALLAGIKAEIDKIPPEQLAAYVETRNKEWYSTYLRVAAKYDPEGYVKHLVYDQNTPSDAYFQSSTPRTITYNPYKLLPKSWAKWMGARLFEYLYPVRDLVSPEAYQQATGFLDQWTNADQAQLDENSIAEEIAHAYDVDHYWTSIDYYRGIFSNADWANVAYQAGFGPAAGQPFEGSWAAKISSFMQDPNSISAVERQTIFNAIVEYRASSLKVYWKTPLAGFTYRVPEVLTNEFKDPSLIERAAQAVGRDWEERLRPAIKQWVASQSQQARPGEVPVSQTTGQGAATTAAAGPTAGANVGATDLSSSGQPVGLPERNAGDQGGLGAATRMGDPAERAALDRLQPRQNTQPTDEAIGQRTVVKQAVTDLIKAGWPEEKRWEQFARAIQDPSSPDYKAAKKVLDKLPPRSQQIFTQVGKTLPEPPLQGPTIPAAQGQEATPEVQREVTRSQVESPQSQAVQKEMAAAQLKIEASGPIIDKMVAAGASLREVNAEKAGLAGLRAYQKALQDGETLLRATALGRDANARELLRLNEIRSGSAPLPELEEEPYKGVFLGKRYAAVDSNAANFLIKRLRVNGYPGLRVDKGGNVNLAEFFDGLFAEDREAEKSYKLLPQTTKEYINAKIGYRGVPKRGNTKTVAPEAPNAVAAGTENYINQTDFEGLEKAIAVVPQQGGFIAIRHGSTVRNGGAGGDEKLRGWDDIPLDDNGEKQAERLAAAFKGMNISVIYASPLKRSLDTANAISKTTGARVVIDPNLKPLHIGEWANQSAKEFGPRVADLARNRPDEVIPGGESWNQYLNRYMPAVKQHMMDALKQDGITLEVNHTRGVRTLKGHIMAGGQGLDINMDPLSSKEEVGPGGIMGLKFENGRWQIAGDFLTNKFTGEKQFSSGEASQKYDIPAGQKAVAAKPAATSYGGDPVVKAVQNDVKEIQANEKRAATIKGELPPIKDINSQIDTISADPTHPANAAAVEAKVLRDIMPRAQELGGAAYDRIKSDYAIALQRFTSRMVQVAKNEPKVAAAQAPRITDQPLFDRTAKLAESLHKRIDKGEDPDAVAHEAAKSIGMTLKKAISALQDKNWQMGKAQNWAPAFQDLILGKAATKIRANRLSNKPGRKSIPFDQSDIVTHVSGVKPVDPAKASAAPKTDRPVPAIAKILKRSDGAPNKEVPAQRILDNSNKEVAQKISDHSKKSSKQLRQESEEINKQINTPSPNPYGGNLFTAPERVNVKDFRKGRRKAGLEEPGMNDGASGKNPPPPDGPGNVLAGWDDARDPVRSFGGKWSKVAEVMDLLVKHYTESLDPGRNQLHHLEQYRLHLGRMNADRNLTRESIRALQDVLPDFKSNKEVHSIMSDAIEEADPTARMELKKQLTPQQAAFVDMWRAWEDVKGKVKVDNDLVKAQAEDYLAHIMKFDENGKALLDKSGRLRSTGLSGRLQWWRDRAVDPETGEVRWPKLSDLRAEFGENNVEGDLTKIFLQENLSFSPRLRFHQMIGDLTEHLVDPAESLGLKMKPGRGFGNLTSGKDVLPYEGHPIVPIGQLEYVPPRFRDQLDTINVGPGKSPLSMFRVYKPLKELIERQADIDEEMNSGLNMASAPLRWANNLYKLYKFVFNPLHMYNVTSDIDMFLSKSPVPMVGVMKAYKNIYDIKNGKSAWSTPVGDLNWNEMITHMADNGATIRDKLIDTANLGALQGHIAQPVKVFGQDVNVFNRFHDLMWVNGVWMGHIALTQHLADYYMKQVKDANGGVANEAQFNQALRLAAAQSNAAVGFLDKGDMSRNWRVIGETLNFANAWSTMQIRNAGGGLKGLPGAKVMQNWGGGERYLNTLTSVLPEGGLTPADMALMNSVQGKVARRFVVNGTLKLLGTAAILGYMGSYVSVLTGQNGAQMSGPWDNFQKDPTHTFDIYGGIDSKTGKQIWYHNPLYNALSELIDYGMGSVKAWQNGSDWTKVLTDPEIRYASGKANPFIGQTLSMLTGQELSRWMAGYSDASIHNDPSVVAIENALSAKGINLPVGLEDRLVYVIREVGPVPGFAGTFSKDQALSTPGDIVNAVGPGKWLGVGDFLNSMQSGDFSHLVPTDLGNLAMFLTGSRKTETATPAQLAQDNQFVQAAGQRQANTDLEKQMLDAAYKGDYKTVASIASQLGYDNNQMVNALLHPPSGSGGGIAYHGTPYQPASGTAQDTLQGYTLNQGQTAELESLKKANFLAMYGQVAASAEWQSSNGSERAAMINSLNSQLMKAVENQYAQQAGIMGGAAITNQDIQDLIDHELTYRGMAQGAIANTQAYIDASPLERARIMKEYKAFGDTIAWDTVFGKYKAVPPERVMALISDTIQVEEGTRDYLKGSVFYQMSDQSEQARMLTEYATLSRTISERYALGQGQGPRGNITLMASQVPMVIQKTIQVEETAKAMLHSTDYYQTGDLATQKSLDSKYETLARSLSFSPTAYTEDPNIVINNSILSEEAYFNLQSQFGGGNYVKLMAQQLSDMELTLRQTADYSPKQIAGMEKAIRAQFLAQNPTYAQYLRVKTAWQKNTPAGQIYSSLNNAEYAAQDELAAADMLSSSILTAGTSSDPYFNPASNLGLTDLGGVNLQPVGSDSSVPPAL